MAKSEAREIAMRCLEAWTTGDFKTTRSLLAEDVTLMGPRGSTHGIDESMKGIEGIAGNIQRTAELKVVAQGEDVCIMYDLTTSDPPAQIPMTGWYHVHDGKVTSIRTFFDARPLEAAMS